VPYLQAWVICAALRQMSCNFPVPSSLYASVYRSSLTPCIYRVFHRFRLIKVGTYEANRCPLLLQKSIRSCAMRHSADILQLKGSNGSWRHLLGFFVTRTIHTMELGGLCGLHAILVLILSCGLSRSWYVGMTKGKFFRCMFLLKDRGNIYGTHCINTRVV